VTGEKLKSLSQALYEVAAANHPAHPDIPGQANGRDTGESTKTHNVRRFEALGIARDDMVAEINYAIITFFKFVYSSINHSAFGRTSI
jgi:hypothetical protein